MSAKRDPDVLGRPGQALEDGRAVDPGAKVLAIEAQARSGGLAGVAGVPPGGPSFSRTPWRHALTSRAWAGRSSGRCSTSFEISSAKASGIPGVRPRGSAARRALL